MKAMLHYIKQHLHIVDFKFDDPCSIPSNIIEEKVKKTSLKISQYLQSNKKMHRVRTTKIFLDIKKTKCNHSSKIIFYKIIILNAFLF